MVGGVGPWIAMSLKLFNLSLPPVLADGFRACRTHIAFGALFSALLNLLYLAPTLYMMQVYDRVVPTEGRLTLLYLTLIVGFALIVLVALDGVRQRLMTLASLRLERTLARPLLERLMATGGSQQGVRDFDTTRQFISGPVALALMDAPWTPVYVLAAFMIHPALGALILVGAAILFFLALGNERATRAKIQDGAARQNQAYALQDAAIRNGEVVRSLGMRDALISNQITDRVAGQMLSARAQFTGGRYSATTKFVRLFLQSAALGLGAWLAIERQISAGSIIAASVLLSRALQPIEQVVGSWTAVGQARTALTNLVALFSNPARPIPVMQLPDPVGKVELEQVSLRTLQGLSLRSVSVAIGPGEVIGIVGPSGAGKTALARVIAGAVSPDLGVIRLDGSDFADWDSDRLGRFIGYLPQTSALMAGTLRDNISRFAGPKTPGRDDIDVAVVEAARAAGVHDMIVRLPGGYDAVLGAGGLGLSAGQAQRIALARALYGKPRLIVLDEPNSALDAEGEEALNRAILTAKAWGATLVIVAHRMGVLSVTDRIVVLRDGQIAKIGPSSDMIPRSDAPPTATAAPAEPTSEISRTRREPAFPPMKAAG